MSADNSIPDALDDDLQQAENQRRQRAEKVQRDEERAQHYEAVQNWRQRLVSAFETAGRNLTVERLVDLGKIICDYDEAVAMPEWPEMKLCERLGRAVEAKVPLEMRFALRLLLVAAKKDNAAIQSTWLRISEKEDLSRIAECFLVILDLLFFEHPEPLPGWTTHELDEVEKAFRGLPRSCEEPASTSEEVSQSDRPPPIPRAVVSPAVLTLDEEDILILCGLVKRSGRWLNRGQIASASDVGEGTVSDRLPGLLEAKLVIRKGKRGGVTYTSAGKDYLLKADLSNMALRILNQSDAGKELLQERQKSSAR
jgi:hypothetical protein